MFGKNTFYKICSKHGPDAKKNYFVFSIIDGGGGVKTSMMEIPSFVFLFLFCTFPYILVSKNEKNNEV